MLHPRSRGFFGHLLVRLDSAAEIVRKEFGLLQILKVSGVEPPNRPQRIRVNPERRGRLLVRRERVVRCGDFAFVLRALRAFQIFLAVRFKRSLPTDLEIVLDRLGIRGRLLRGANRHAQCFNSNFFSVLISECNFLSAARGTH